MRVLLKLQAHQRVIDRDPSGRVALRWLMGNAGCRDHRGGGDALGMKALCVRLLREAHRPMRIRR
jgi:hypothetical protein